MATIPDTRTRNRYQITLRNGQTAEIDALSRTDARNRFDGQRSKAEITHNPVHAIVDAPTPKPHVPNDLIDASRAMLEVEASACLRSEAIGETGMRERFTALRQALHRLYGEGRIALVIDHDGIATEYRQDRSTFLADKDGK